MKKLIVASNNQHKIGEIKEILKGLALEIVSLKEMNIDIDVEEDGKTFNENAYKKAHEIYLYLKNRGEKDFLVMSDDSGLMVDALNGEPGVYSARYAGEHGDSKKNNEKLLLNLKNVKKEDRGAQFVCSIVLMDEDGQSETFEGLTRGFITECIVGAEGFGYDPLFFIEDKNMTFAEMSSEEKNNISHRGRALDKFKKEINRYI